MCGGYAKRTLKKLKSMELYNFNALRVNGRQHLNYAPELHAIFSWKRTVLSLNSDKHGCNGVYALKQHIAKFYYEDLACDLFTLNLKCNP